MSEIKKLIERLCPDGVEYKKLGEICEINRGVRVVRKDLSDEGLYPVFQNSLTPLGYYDKSNYPAGTTFIISAGAAGQIGYSDVDFWAADDCVCLKCPKELSSRYLYHLILHHNNYFLSRVRKASVPRLSRVAIDNFEIPVPPIEVQSKIVEILDNFTELEAELEAKLEAELEARRKQYEYYRNQLLTFDKVGGARFGVKWMKLGEIASFTYGYTDKAQEIGNARFIRITDIDDMGNLHMDNPKYVTMTEESKKYLLKSGDLLMARTGATYGKTLYVSSDEPAVYASFLIKVAIDQSILLNRYYWHFSKSSLYWRQADKLVSKGGQQQFNTNAIGRVLVPVPPLSEQQRIVSILDRFEALTTDLQSGLPAEIEARRKQYEYYREQLLTFKRKTA